MESDLGNLFEKVTFKLRSQWECVEEKQSDRPKVSNICLTLEKC
jgi:hypothetical protein